MGPGVGQTDEPESVRVQVSLLKIAEAVPSLIISLWAESSDGEIVLGNALTSYEWVSLEEAKDYELIPGIYEELVMLDKKLKGENKNE